LKSMVTAVKSWLSSYSEIATEYYDERRHPTCANFRAASAFILRTWLRSFLKRNSVIVETGAGASVALELIQDLRVPAALIVSDRSPAMLNQRHEFISGTCLVSDAEQLAVRSASVDAILASLGDPYNTSTFWRECSRVLRPGGRVFFTTPSFEWARSFRNESGAPPMAAEFELADGRALFVPSLVLSPTEQVALIRSAGLNVGQERHVDCEVIPRTRRSPKLRTGAIVSGYLAELSLASNAAS